VSVLPRLTPATDLGAVGVASYAKREATDVATFLDRFGATLTADQVGQAVVDLTTNPSYEQNAYLVTAAGISPAP
jgi:hypothetical protein